MEGGIAKPDKTEFTECWKTTRRTPYIMRLALSAGLGGLLFGYDTGVISGALLYIRDDFVDVDKKTWLQETIVSMAVAGAIVGAAAGGWLSDAYGRKKAILCADFMFFSGAIVMAIAPTPWVIIVGRILVGLGVGMASMTAPLYISESSPARIRGALVPGTWRWMLGVAGVPALLQFILMLSLPESPRWLYRKDKVEEAGAILAKLHPPHEVEQELKAMKASIEQEKAEEGHVGEGSIISKVKKALSNQVVRRGLYAGVIVQLAQQFVGINTVMYYSPTIVQFAGFASNKTALALSLVTSGLNAAGSILVILFVDRFGRRRMMIISMIGIISCLVALSVVFMESSSHAPAISQFESTRFGMNSTCLNYIKATDAPSWNCMKCLAASKECAFCSSTGGQLGPGGCVSSAKQMRGTCTRDHRTFFTNGCPSRFGFLAVILLGLYIVSYSPGMGTVPWIVNSEIYPQRFRGVCGGMAAVSNWCANLLVSETFLTLTETLGSSGTFLLFAAVSFTCLVGIYFLVPETKGLPFEEVEKMLKKGFRPRACFWKNSKDEAGGGHAAEKLEDSPHD